MLPVLLVAVVILAVGGAAVGAIASRHKSTPAKSAASTTTSVPSGQPAAAGAPAPPADPGATAAAIGLQAKDLNGYAFKKDQGGSTQTYPYPNVPCGVNHSLPVASQPWVVADSAVYANEANSAHSSVALLPSAADAHSALGAVLFVVTPACVKPVDDAAVNQVLASANQNSAATCPASLGSSSAQPLMAATAWPGVVGIRYVANITCGGPLTQLTLDSVFRVVGNVLIQGNFVLAGGPQPTFEQDVMNAMAARAQAYVAHG